MNILITYTATELQKLVIADLQQKLGEIGFDPTKVKIETRSKQNFRAEWETAEYRAVYQDYTV